MCYPVDDATIEKLISADRPEDAVFAVSTTLETELMDVEETPVEKPTATGEPQQKTIIDPKINQDLRTTVITAAAKLPIQKSHSTSTPQ